MMENLINFYMTRSVPEILNKLICSMPGRIGKCKAKGILGNEFVYLIYIYNALLDNT